MGGKGAKPPTSHRLLNKDQLSVGREPRWKARGAALVQGIVKKLNGEYNH